MGGFINVLKGNGIPALFYLTTIAFGALISHWKALPSDTSSLPLAVVTTSQSCLLGFWLVHCSKTWLARLFLPSVLLGCTSSLRWATDGMHIPADILWLSLYPLEGLVPLVLVTLAALILKSTTKLVHIEPTHYARFSVADLLWVTTMFAIGLFAILALLPDPTNYQYANDFGRNWWQERAICVSLIATSTLLVFWIVQIQGLPIRALTWTILCTLIAGLLTARLLGIDGNPNWSFFALAPSSVAIFVAIALLIHYQAAAPWGSSGHLDSSSPIKPNNKRMHPSCRSGVS